MLALVSRKAEKFSYIFLIALSCLVAVNLSAQEAVDSVPPYDKIYTEINLTPEGVVAQDSNGSYWTWDFTDNRFKLGKPIWIEFPNGEEPPDSPDLPIEFRAVNEKIIDDDSRRIVIEPDEYVDGDITTTAEVTVKGWVKGSIRSYDRVQVAESGRVDGSIRAPRVIVKDGGEVLGRIYETEFITEIPDVFTTTISNAGWWVFFSFTIFLIITGALVIALIPERLQKFTVCATEYTSRSFFLGLLFTLLLPMVFVLVVITIVGVLICWAVPLAYLVAFIIGIVIVGRDTGRKLIFRLTGKRTSDIISYLVGLALLMTFWLLVTILMGSNDDVAFGFGVFFLIVSILITCYPTMIGVGAAFMTRFGFRECSREAKMYPKSDQPMHAPAPPPIPNGHPGFRPEQAQPPTPPPPPKAPPAIFPPKPGSDRPDRPD